jgi:hypothetical protein
LPQNSGHRAFRAGRYFFFTNTERGFIMSSAAQRSASKTNADSSTGPRTASGKAASARNAITHGLAAKDFIVLPGQREYFEDFLSGLETEIRPKGALEQDLFLQLAHAAWTLRRCRAAEVMLQAACNDPSSDVMIEAACFSRYQNIDLYSRRAQRAYYRALAELRKVQTEHHYRVEIAVANDLPHDSVGSCISPVVDNVGLQAACRVVYSEAFVAKACQTADRFPRISDAELLAAYKRREANGQTNVPVNPASRTAARL